MAILSATNLSLYYGDLRVFEGVSAEVGEKAHIGIVGPNGGGKTSLLRMLLGEIEPGGGSVNRTRNTRAGYVPQAPPMLAGGTIRDEVLMAFDQLKLMESRMAELAEAMSSGPANERSRAERAYGDLLHEYEERGGYTQLNAMERAISGVGLAEETLETPSSAASGGERTRAALARALLADPDLLVLDEPTNHLDLTGLAWLERFLSRFPHAFIVVSHDRYFLDRVATEIWELEGGHLQSFPGNYTRYRELKAEQLAQQQREFEKQQAYITKEEEFIRRYGAGQRSQEAQGRETRLRRLERLEAPEDQSTARMVRITAARSSQAVVQTKGLRVGIFDGPEPTLLADVPDLKLERGSRTAIIGDNGTGKTTLLRTLLGQIPAVAGSAIIGSNVEVGYYRQGLEDLPSGVTVLDALLEVKPMSQGEARGYLARFLFQRDDVFQHVDTLSGGERGRLSLARMLAQAPNFLCLDEPTNHLDIPSREAMEQVLLSYEGTLLFISHDRRLVSLLATQLWVVEDRKIKLFDGKFEEWAALKEREARAVPSRVVSKPARVPEPRPSRPQKAAPSAQEKVAKRIAELEEQLSAIEEALQIASASQDIGAIARLGEEHRATQLRLDKAWEEWAL